MGQAFEQAWQADEESDDVENDVKPESKYDPNKLLQDDTVTKEVDVIGGVGGAGPIYDLKKAITKAYKASRTINISDNTKNSIQEI